jgi:iron complex outermembrane recepter protein
MQALIGSGTSLAPDRTLMRVDVRASGGNFPAGPPFFGAPMPPVYPFGLSDASGNQLAQAPEWTSTVSVRYEQPIFTGWNGFVQADAVYRSSFNFQALQNPHTAVDDTAVFGMSLGMQSDDGHLTFTLFGRNLGDERIPTFITPTSTADLVGDTAPPGQGNYAQSFTRDSFRTIGIALDYRM